MSNVILFPAKAKTGPCVGCSEQSVMVRYTDEDGEHEDACGECVNGPVRGKRWLFLARRVRKDPGFAKACFQQMLGEAMKNEFRLRFGTPWVKAC